jgi:hypothetical protein
MKIITILLFFTCVNIFSQNSSQFLNEKKEGRKIFLYSNLGILDFISLGVGYQASENVAISIKGSQTFITGSGAFGLPNSGAGIGAKFTYSTSFLFFNSISAEYISYLSLTYDKSILPASFIKGHYFDLNIGYENINDAGLSFFWATGICISAVKTKNVLYSPSLKIGLNYNFN